MVYYYLLKPDMSCKRRPLGLLKLTFYLVKTYLLQDERLPFARVGCGVLADMPYHAFGCRLGHGGSRAYIFW